MPRRLRPPLIGSAVADPAGRRALAYSAGWISLAISFAGVLYARFGARPALEFLTGYVIEKALSVDNLFVILLILTSFAVPRALFHRVLGLGILGAIVMRGALIVAGGDAFPQDAR